MGKAARVLCLLSVTVSSTVVADERHFTFTYESAVLPRLENEIELWITPRAGRRDYFLGFDYRLEFERGIADRLVTALYFNFSHQTAGAAHNTSTDWSFSNEWKYKVLDPVGDPVGLALYGEITGGPHQLDLETKLILDKYFAGFIAALNLVTEYGWEFRDGKTTRDLRLEADSGVVYSLGAGFFLGLEGRNETIISSDGGFESSAFFAGPVFSYAASAWWATATLLPQLGAIQSTDLAAASNSHLDLVQHERFVARLLVGIHL